MNKTAGMTLVELLVVMALVSILFGLSTIGIFSSQQKVMTSSFITTLVTDLKQQQLKAMIGDTEGRATHDSYGIVFQSARYILFHGTTYIPGDTTNFIVNNDTNIVFSNINLPNSQIIFKSVSGEINNYNSSQNTVTIRNNSNNQQKIIYLNQYGVITSIN